MNTKPGAKKTAGNLSVSGTQVLSAGPNTNNARDTNSIADENQANTGEWSKCGALVCTILL